jgi:FG-GAP-like repeat
VDKLWIASSGIVALAASAALAPSACATLNDLPENTCGNLIIEQANGEDCDGNPIGSDGGVTAAPAGFTCSSACRVTCTAASDAGVAQCPDGWGCGVDGICRRPAGTFTAAGVDITENVDHLLLGDLDGDGRKDVVVDTGVDLRVHYFGDDGVLEQTTSIDAEQPSPALGDFNNDGITDISYRLDSAVTVRLGSADRALSAVPFPLPLPTSPDLSVKTTERLIAIDAIGAGGVGIDPSKYKLRELLRVEPGSVTTFFGISTDPAAVVTLAPTGQSALPTTVTPIPVGWFDEAAPCSQFVLANNASNVVEVYRPCVAGAPFAQWNEGGAPITVKLPSTPTTVVVAGPAYAVDVNHDGHLDLVVYAVDTTTKEIQLDVAYGDGTGAFGSTPLANDSLADRYLCLTTISLKTGMDSACAVLPPLAVADFDGDGALDVVNECGVFLAEKGTGTCGQYGALTATALSGSGLAAAVWTTARVVDLNGDGAPDVVAGTCQEASITYLENAGSGIFNTYQIPTTGGVDDLEVGDFDGDLVPDVLFSERTSPLLCSDATVAPTAESIGIVFGARSSGPSAPVELADLPPLSQLVPGYLTSPTDAYDKVTDLVALAADGDSGQYLFDVFQGSTDRQIIAPYFLIDPSKGQPNTPWLVGMGRLLGSDKGDGLVVLSSEPPTASAPMPGAVPHEAKLWLFSSESSDLSSDGLLSLPNLGDPSTYAYSTTKGAWLSMANLGGPNGDTALGLAFNTGTSTLYTAAATATGWSSAAPSGQVLSGTFEGPIVVTDVDGDGGDDVILVSATDGVMILWNQHDGSLDPTSATIVSSELAKPCSDAPGQTQRAVALHAAPGKPRQLLVVTEAHVYLVAIDPKSHAVTSASCFEGDQQLPRSVLGAGTLFLAAGDVDGDGVDDVVVGNATAGSVTVYLGAPVVR